MTRTCQLGCCVLRGVNVYPDERVLQVLDSPVAISRTVESSGARQRAEDPGRDLNSSGSSASPTLASDWFTWFYKG